MIGSGAVELGNLPPGRLTCAEATVTNRDWKEIENELTGSCPPSVPKARSCRRQITAFPKRSTRTKGFFWRTSLTLWFKRILSSISGLKLALRRSCFPYDSPFI